MGADLRARRRSDTLCVPNTGLLVVWEIKKVGQGVQIVVPDGSTVSDNLFSAGGTISPPAGFVNWAAVGGTPSGGWHITNAGRDRIEIPAGLACRQRSRQDSRSAWLHSQGEGTVQRRGFWPAFRTLRSRAWANALRIR